MRRLFAIVALSAVSALSAPPERFRQHVIAEDLSSGYQVIAVDMDLDGDSDLVALASRMAELVWYENPTWNRHVLSSGRSRMINLAACGTDSDGYPVFVLAEEFENKAAASKGTVLVLERGDGAGPWKATEIDRLPTSHRIRCADIDGSGQLVYVNAPLIGEHSEGPEFRDPVPLVYYRPGRWKRVVIGDENPGVMHGIHVIDWDGDGRDEILTASFSGIHLYDWKAGEWSRQEIAEGDPSPWPKSGSSDLAVGQLQGTRFIASIEPWHGNQLAIYTKGETGWRRNVVDDSFVDGHTVVAADLNGDGRDEVIAGHRRAGGGVYIYEAQAEGQSWVRSPLDVGGVAAAACAVEDFNSDGLPDIACIGSSTANLKWYEQTGDPPPQ
jgi:hypothetical protein